MAGSAAVVALNVGIASGMPAARSRISFGKPFLRLRAYAFTRRIPLAQAALAEGSGGCP